MSETSIQRARRLAREKREREEKESAPPPPPPSEEKEDEGGFFGSFFDRGKTIDESVEGAQRKRQSTDSNN